mmetsp:Transcript_47658/g.94049  ORF Transcript_47658/g.94049 Transcript_47658/m.94049 type:complete len:200 (+) Transcript_47658:104-703(+)
MEKRRLSSDDLDTCLSFCCLQRAFFGSASFFSNLSVFPLALPCHLPLPPLLSPALSFNCFPKVAIQTVTSLSAPLLSSNSCTYMCTWAYTAHVHMYGWGDVDVVGSTCVPSTPPPPSFPQIPQGKKRAIPPLRGASIELALQSARLLEHGMTDLGRRLQEHTRKTASESRGGGGLKAPKAQPKKAQGGAAAAVAQVGFG